MTKLLLALALVAANQSHAATIYLCKAYNGSTFWAKAHCNQHNALIERIESVADVPWDQQVEQANAGRANATSSTTRQQGATDTAHRCASLANELHEIESRYSKGQWQPVEVVNPDQKRQRAIRSELSRNHCPVQ
jgi:hypothetical protein